MAVLVLLTLALTWHLVAMDHHDGMGMLGGCLSILAAALLLVPPFRRSLGSPIDIDTRSAILQPLSPIPLARPPPMEGPLRGSVLQR